LKLAQDHFSLCCGRRLVSVLRWDEAGGSEDS